MEKAPGVTSLSSWSDKEPNSASPQVSDVLDLTESHLSHEESNEGTFLRKSFKRFLSWGVESRGVHILYFDT